MLWRLFKGREQCISQKEGSITKELEKDEIRKGRSVWDRGGIVNMRVRQVRHR